MSATSASTLDGLARTSTRLFDDCLLPRETVKIRDEARLFAERVLAPRAAELNSAEESSAVFPATSRGRWPTPDCTRSRSARTSAADNCRAGVRWVPAVGPETLDHQRLCR